MSYVRAARLFVRRRARSDRGRALATCLFSTASSRVGQPGPLARKYSSTSGESRMLMARLRPTFGGRARRGLSKCSAPAPNCSRRTSGAGCARATTQPSNAQQMESALAASAAARAEALVVHPDALMVEQRAAIARFSLERRVPLISGWAAIADGGGLMTYGPNLQECYRRLAYFVDRILRGARPAELPIELAQHGGARRQPQDGEGTRPHRPAGGSAARGPGDCVSVLARADRRVRIPPAMLIRANPVIE